MGATPTSASPSAGRPEGAGTEEGDPRLLALIRGDLELTLDRLRDATRMASMLARTSDYEADPRVEILTRAVELTVGDLVSLRDLHLRA